MIAPDLKPRAIAVLCALRLGARTSGWLRSAIGDSSCSSGSRPIYDLLADLRKLGLVDSSSTGVEVRWHLTHDGIGWCESNGMLVDSAAHCAASSEPQAVRP